MAGDDYKARALRAFEALVLEVERIAQESASTEAALYAKGKTEEWKRNATFEHELQREIDCWNAISAGIGQRVADRSVLLEEQRERRRHDL